MAMMSGTDSEFVWRFGYGSNIGRATLETKKNLSLKRFMVGTIQGWSLHIGPGIDYVEPGFAGIHPTRDAEKTGGELHGSAFLIPRAEAEGLDRQEGGYYVLPSRFTSYDGEVVEGVGLYVPKKFVDGDGNVIKEAAVGSEQCVASLRYLTLIRKGAEEAGLREDWIKQLYSFEHYVTPADVRSKTDTWIEEFHCDADRKDNLWTAEHLAKHDGSNPESFPAHVAVMEYVVKIAQNAWVFSSWKGHCITRRNLLHFNGKSIDSNDIQWNEPGFRPLPVARTDEEKEYLMQNLEKLLHPGGTIVARLKECLEDQVGCVDAK